VPTLFGLLLLPQMNAARNASSRAALAVSLENNLTTEQSFSSKLSLVRSIPLFHYTSEKDLQTSLRLLDTLRLVEGEHILKQGDDVFEDGNFFILVEGEATVYIRSASSRRTGLGVRVARLTPGDVFGHEALIDPSNIRGGTVVASTDVKLYVGDKHLLLQIVDTIPQAVQRSVLTNFSDLRQEDTASLAAFAHKIRSVIKSVGAEVLAFELEQDHLIRQTKTSNNGARNLDTPHVARTMSTSQRLTLADDDWSILLGGKHGNGEDEEMTAREGSNVATRSTEHHPGSTSAMVTNIFTQRHVELLRKLIPPIESNDDDREVKKVKQNKIDPRRQRLLDVNRLLLDECIAHRRRMDAMHRHQLSSLAAEAVARKKQGSDAAKMHIAGSYVPELSATDMLGVVLHTVASLCGAEGIAIFVGCQNDNPMGGNNDSTNRARINSTGSRRVSFSSSFDVDPTVDMNMSNMNASFSQHNGASNTNGWSLLCSYDRKTTPQGDGYYTPSPHPGPKFRKRIASKVLTKNSVELETLGSGREVMSLSIRGLHATAVGKNVASTYRRRGSISGNVTAGALLSTDSGMRSASSGSSGSSGSHTSGKMRSSSVGGGKGGGGGGNGGGGGSYSNNSTDSWDTAVIQLIRAEPFSPGDEQVLLAAREHLHGSIWQQKLEKVEELLSSRSTMNSSSPVNGSNTGDGNSSTTQEHVIGGTAPYESAHRIHRSLQLRVCKVSGLPWWAVEKGNHGHASVRSRRKTKSAPQKTTKKNTLPIVVRARVYHGTAPLSPSPTTTSQLPFIDTTPVSGDGEGEREEKEKEVNDNGERKATRTHAPTHSGLFMLNAIEEDEDGDRPSKKEDEENYMNGRKGGNSTKNNKNKHRLLSSNKSRKVSVVSHRSTTSTMFFRKEIEEEDALGQPTLVQAQWYDWINLGIPVQDIPRAARIVFEVLVPDPSSSSKHSSAQHSSSSSSSAASDTSFTEHNVDPHTATPTLEKRLGWTVLPLYALDQVMQSGRLALHLFPGETFDLGLGAMYNGLEGGDLERAILHTSLYQHQHHSPAAASSASSAADQENDSYSTQNKFASHYVPAWWSARCHTKLTIEMFRYSDRCDKIVYRDRHLSRVPSPLSSNGLNHRLNPDVLRILSSKSPTVKMSSMDARNVWFARDTLTAHPRALIHVLRCVDWSRYEQVQEMYALLHHWSPLPSSIALNLLGPEIVDPNIRAFAVSSGVLLL
jgi:CRP-like cAMP-binding protein